MIFLTRETIDISELVEKLDRQGAGSVVMHFGVVKPDPEGKKSEGITFSPLDGLEAEMEAIESDLRDKYNLLDVVLARRLGTLAVGDLINAALVCAKGRDDAFGAGNEAVNRFKKMKSLHKEEHYIS